VKFNGAIITNRREFCDKFELKEAFNKCDAVCDFFGTKISDITEKEIGIIEFLRGKKELPENLVFEYAAEAEKKYNDVSENMGEEERLMLLRAILLLELARKNGREFRVSDILADFKEVTKEEFHTVYDISGHIGSVVLEKYRAEEPLSANNRMVLKTFVNNSAYSGNTAEITVRGESVSQKIVLGCGEAVTGSFVNGKLAALFPPVDVGDKHIIVNDGGGKFRRISPGEEIKERRYVFSENAVFMSATNDGGVFVDGNEIEIRSNAQPCLYEISLKDDERIISAYVRREKYAVLTDCGRLLCNNGSVLENIICALIRKNGECFALSSDEKLYRDGKPADISDFYAYTDYELINFGGTKLYNEEDIREFAKWDAPADIDYSYFGKYDGCTVLKTADGIKIGYSDGKVFRVENNGEE